ncbi:transposase [Candidatus Kaiserbacteria bacterium]|nr:transposase [Candidatus Kaiserbacteria bacterium]USN92075.1 MAG: transposase [Candidatus Nomurabacteria bacterium]
MTKKNQKISAEIKEEIVNKIKHEGISVKEAAGLYAVSDRAIYDWLGNKARGSVSLLEHNRLKRENEQLKQLVGEVTLRLSTQEKRG